MSKKYKITLVFLLSMSIGIYGMDSLVPFY